jgi:ABC-type glycerol-3-phosphate transport system permease component
MIIRSDTKSIQTVPVQMETISYQNYRTTKRNINFLLAATVLTIMTFLLCGCTLSNHLVIAGYGFLKIYTI